MREQLYPDRAIVWRRAHSLLEIRPILRELKRARWTRQIERMGPPGAALAEWHTFRADGEDVLRIAYEPGQRPVVEVRRG